MGTFSDSFLLASQNLTAGGGLGAYVAKLNITTGAALWATRTCSTLQAEGKAICLVDSGDIIVVGTSQVGRGVCDGVVWGCRALRLAAATTSRCLSAPCTAVSIRTRRPCSHPPPHPPLDPYALQGNTTGFAGLTAAGLTDGYVARLNGDTGVALWATSLGGTGNEDLLTVAVSQTNGVEVMGSFTYSMMVGTTNLTTKGQIDVFLAALNATSGTPH